MAEKTSPAKTKAAKTTPDGDRIAKVLSRAGVASRREAERMIELGEVQVNGKTITSPALNVTPADRITVRGDLVGEPEPARLWLYYKRDGLVTTNSDEKGRETIYDHLPEDLPRVMTIGRLDLNSEGLLLLTNDGELKRKLELPSTGWLRKYRVRVKGNPTDPDLEPLRKGIVIDGERFLPMGVQLDRHQGANAWLTIGIREGKNREIRRAIDSIGLIVNRLIRISYGPFRLGELEPGQVEEVKSRTLRDQLGTGATADPDDPAKPRAKPRTIARPKPTDTTVKVSRAPRGRASAGGAESGAEVGADVAKPRTFSTKPAPKPAAKPGSALNTLSRAWKSAITPDAPAKAPGKPRATPKPKPAAPKSQTGARGAGTAPRKTPPKR